MRAPPLVALERSPLVAWKPKGLQWHLTPPSSGHPPARFACFRPPLMSNVRSHPSVSLSYLEQGCHLRAAPRADRGARRSQSHSAHVFRALRHRPVWSAQSRYTRNPGALARSSCSEAPPHMVCMSARRPWLLDTRNAGTAVRRNGTFAARCLEAQRATVASNHSIERTSLSWLRQPKAAAHVER